MGIKTALVFASLCMFGACSSGPSSGETAPDIEGVDLDGVSFKLSDYQGKVVFVDFWGDW